MSSGRPTRGFRIAPDLDEALRAYAASLERPVSWVIEKAIREYLGRREVEGVEKVKVGARRTRG